MGKISEFEIYILLFVCFYRIYYFGNGWINFDITNWDVMKSLYNGQHSNTTQFKVWGKESCKDT